MATWFSSRWCGPTVLTELPKAELIHGISPSDVQNGLLWANYCRNWHRCCCRLRRWWSTTPLSTWPSSRPICEIRSNRRLCARWRPSRCTSGSGMRAARRSGGTCSLLHRLSRNISERACSTELSLTLWPLGQSGNGFNSMAQETMHTPSSFRFLVRAAPGTGGTSLGVPRPGWPGRAFVLRTEPACGCLGPFGLRSAHASAP